MAHRQTASDWSDLPILLAIARHGTLRGAAEALSVSRTTVMRRIDSFEATLGARLFQRGPSGRHDLTPVGQEVFEAAQQLEDLVQGMENRIQGRDLELAGPLHVTMPAAFVPVLSRDLAVFSERYPQIELSLAAGLGAIDLPVRESDVALRVTERPSADLLGRRLGLVFVGIYGAAAYLERRNAQVPLEQHDFVGWDASLSYVTSARWLEQNVPRARLRCRVSQDWQIKEAVDAGIGLSLVPCVLGDSQPHWRRVKILPELTMPLWLLSHRDLRTTARMRACREFVADAVLAKLDLIEGRRPVEVASSAREPNGAGAATAPEPRGARSRVAKSGAEAREHNKNARLK